MVSGSILIVLMWVAVLIGALGIIFLFINAERRKQGTKMLIGAVIGFIVFAMMFVNLWNLPSLWSNNWIKEKQKFYYIPYNLFNF